MGPCWSHGCSILVKLCDDLIATELKKKLREEQKSKFGIFKRRKQK